MIFLSYAGHSNVLRSIRELFGIPLATTFRIIEKASNFINSVSIKYIRLPGLNELNFLEAGFRSLADFPGTILAIDGTHISITAPSVSQNLYYNRKKFFSLNVLALVDHGKKIRFITTGYGSNHDMRVLRNSEAIQNFIEGIPPRFHIVGDKAFRSIPQIKIPGIGQTIDEERDNNLGIQRIIVENAFGLLKGKFKRFSHNQKNGETQKYMKMFISSCVIHNLMITLED